MLGLKRKFEEEDSGSPYSAPKDSDDDIFSSDSADSCDSVNSPSVTPIAPASILRRHKPFPGRKSVRFDVVTVYYFSRRQGFTSVPSQGGSSLGMAHHHSAIRRYTLGEFAREQESSHRQALRQHLRQEKLNARRLKLTHNGTVECAEADSLTLEDVSDEDLDVEGVEVDDCFFLQPLPTKRRRALLRASGIARIDAGEKTELRAIRLSREECGCDCRFYCDPRRCVCCQAGIKCQVDRMSFPCGCSRDGCGNVAGRIEFNPLRVRTHYLHTIMKLDLEKKRQLGVGVGESFVAAEALAASSVSCCELSTSDAANRFSTEVHSRMAPNESTDTDVDYMSQGDCLALENETAVLHLQSAEELERRREQEEEEANEGGSTGAGSLGDSGFNLLAEPLQEGLAGEQGAEPVVIHGDFPPGMSVLCFTENQEGAHNSAFSNPSSLVYYQIGDVEPAAFVLPVLQPGEDGKPGRGGEDDQKEEKEQVNLEQDYDEGGNNIHPGSPQRPPEPPQETHYAFEEEENHILSEV